MPGTCLNEISRSISLQRPSQPLEELREFVAGISARKITVPNRRRFPRWHRIIDVTMVPLDAALRPIGPSMRGCTRNISTGGICFYQLSQCPTDFLYLEIETSDSTSMKTVMKTCRQTRVDQFWEIAGKIMQGVELNEYQRLLHSELDAELAAIDQFFTKQALRMPAQAALRR